MIRLIILFLRIIMQSKSKEIRELAINAVMSKSLTPQKAAEVAGVSVPTIYL